MLQRYVKLAGMKVLKYPSKLNFRWGIKPLFRHACHTNRNAYKTVKKVGGIVLDL